MRPHPLKERKCDSFCEALFEKHWRMAELLPNYLNLWAHSRLQPSDRSKVFKTSLATIDRHLLEAPMFLKMSLLYHIQTKKLWP
jgi:hypothetical protein